MKLELRHPIYVISKGRFETCLTAKHLIENDVDFKLVVEPQEEKEYSSRYGAERVLVLPFSNLGLGSIPARNWVWEHAKEAGHERHWIFDDNIRHFYRRYRTKRLYCDPKFALKALEDFVNRYENVAVAGFNYSNFVHEGRKIPPFYLNVHVYSALLIFNSLPHRWRGRYNEDTDLSLQVLADGWCTILFNAFSIQKIATMRMKGGNTDELYKGTGRLKMARSLERLWPRAVRTGWRFNRPQHIVFDGWKRFNTPLKRKPEFTKIEDKPNEYGMKLHKIKPEVKSGLIRRLLGDDR